MALHGHTPSNLPRTRSAKTYDILNHDVGLHVSPSNSLFNRPITLAPYLPELSQLFLCVTLEPTYTLRWLPTLWQPVSSSCTLLEMTKTTITDKQFLLRHHVAW